MEQCRSGIKRALMSDVRTAEVTPQTVTLCNSLSRPTEPRGAKFRGRDAPSALSADPSRLLITPEKKIEILSTHTFTQD